MHIQYGRGFDEWFDATVVRIGQENSSHNTYKPNTLWIQDSKFYNVFAYYRIFFPKVKFKKNLPIQCPTIGRFNITFYLKKSYLFGHTTFAISISCLFVFKSV